MALDPLVPFIAAVAPIALQNGPFDQNTLAGESVLASLASPPAKALQAEINSAAALKNPAYTRP